MKQHFTFQWIHIISWTHLGWNSQPEINDYEI